MLGQYNCNSAVKLHLKESQPHFSVFCLDVLVSLVSWGMKEIPNVYRVDIIYFIPHSLYGVLIDFKGSYHNIRMRLGIALVACDL